MTQRVIRTAIAFMALAAVEASGQQAEDEYVIISAENYDLVVPSISKYHEGKPWLPMIVTARFHDLQRITPELKVIGAENPTTFKEVTNIFDLNCESMTLASPAEAFFVLYDVVGSHIGWSESAYFAELFEPLKVSILGKAIRFTCVVALSDHPFRKNRGWTLVAQSRTDRIEIYEKPNAVGGVTGEFWFVASGTDTDLGKFGSARTLELIDCKKRYITTLQRHNFDAPFAGGTITGTVNYRENPSRLAPEAAAPGTVGEAMIDAACKLIPRQ